MTFVVDDQGDAVDNSIGDGVCAATISGGTHCTLRAAIQEANAQYAAGAATSFTVTVPGAISFFLPPRVYAITLPGSGEDNAATGDLDIKCNLLLKTANGLPAVVNANGLDRAFQILSPNGITVSVAFQNIWMVNGSVTDQGGALLAMPNTAVSISSSRITTNTVTGLSPKGGAIANGDHSSIALDNVLFRANAVVVTNNGSGAGGAIATNGNIAITNSSIVSNTVRPANPGFTTSAQGGGIQAFCCEGPVVVSGTAISDNAIFVSGANQLATGGGISAGLVPITVTNSAIEGNLVSGASPAPLVLEGGGLYSEGTVRVFNSRFQNNAVSGVSGVSIFDGGGMTLNGNAQIVSSTVSVNSVKIGDAVAGYGGGINLGGRYFGANVLVDRSTILDNFANDGGGLNTFVTTTLQVRDSTVVGNVATNGGGIFNLGLLTVTNSTFYFNVASKSGGGIYNESTATIASATFTGNAADSDGDNVGDGGGIFVAGGSTLFLKSSILTGEEDRTASGPIYPDCAGTIISLDYNIIQQSPSPGCTILGSPAHDRHGTFANVLSPDFADNGGNTQTVALPPGSIAINGGDPTGCKDETGQPLTTDQRGFTRVGACDIGAVERELPVLSTLNPATAAIGGPDLAVAVAGHNFLSNTIVLLNGSQVTATVIDFSDISAVIPAAKLTALGTLTLTARYGADPATLSNALTFTVTKADQTITFGPLSDRSTSDPPFAVTATASSGLPVSFDATGNCTVSGSNVTLTGAGSCTVTASQPGNGAFNAAPSVPRSFAITEPPQSPAPPPTMPQPLFVPAVTVNSQVSG